MQLECNCDKVAVSGLKKKRYFWEKLDFIGSVQWRSSGSDSLPLCFGHFPTSYVKINCMKNSQQF